MAVVLIWLPKHGNIGHMSLRVTPDLYISFWPQEDCGPLDGFVPSHGQTYEEDCYEEGYEDDDGNRISRAPDETVDLDFDLDVSAVRSWWDNFKCCGYNCVLRNCCDAVEKAIIKGIGLWNFRDEWRSMAIRRKIGSVTNTFFFEGVTRKKRSK